VWRNLRYSWCSDRTASLYDVHRCELGRTNPSGHTCRSRRRRSDSFLPAVRHVYHAMPGSRTVPSSCLIHMAAWSLVALPCLLWHRPADTISHLPELHRPVDRHNSSSEHLRRYADARLHAAMQCRAVRCCCSVHVSVRAMGQLYKGYCVRHRDTYTQPVMHVGYCGLGPIELMRKPPCTSHLRGMSHGRNLSDIPMGKWAMGHLLDHVWTRHLHSDGHLPGWGCLWRYHLGPGAS
jgi:hypothetical protein